LKKSIALLLASLVWLAPTASIAVSAPKTGTACKSVGLKAKNLGDDFVCAKVGKALVWKKTSSVKKSASSTSEYVPAGYPNSRCSFDAQASPEMQVIENYLLSTDRCIGPVRVVPANLPAITPTSQLTLSSDLLNVELCKLQTNQSNNTYFKGFPSPSQAARFALERHPGPGTVIQVVPVTASDAPTHGKSPTQDYQVYLDYLKSYFQYINDGQGSVQFRIPEKYIPMPQPIAHYGVTHGNDSDLATAFAADAISAADSSIDFSTANFTMILVPAGTPLNVIGENGFRDQVSQDGPVRNVMVEQPATFTKGERTATSGNSSPSMWLHEFYHPGLNLDDGDGDASMSGVYDDGRGMGSWGLMTGGTTDLLTWQKWLLGFTLDSQVRCASPSSTSVSWLAPSTVKTQHEKMLVVPLSSSSAIVVESMRANGLNYKLSSADQGALVYVLDETDTRHGYGYQVLYPDTRPFVQRAQGGMSMEFAPLRKGDSVTYKGVKISNIEWGDFGDVVKVEKLN
jgi:M6 family metalloprotease-like protein